MTFIMVFFANFGGRIGKDNAKSALSIRLLK